MTILLTHTKEKSMHYGTHVARILRDAEHTLIPCGIFPGALLWYRVVKKARALFITTYKGKIMLTLPARLLGLKVFWIEEHLLDRRLRKKLVRFFMRLASRFATIITPARIIKKQLTDAGVSSERIQIIPLGIDSEKLGFQSSLFVPLAQQKSTLQKNFSIGTIASLERDKGLEYLLQAIKIGVEHVPRLHATIIGHGPAKQELQWLAKKLGVAPHVLFVGWQERHEQWVQNFDLIVMPHLRKEGFSEILITAMALGKPIIATHVDPFPEIIEKRKTGILIEPANATMLAEAILNLYHHPEWRKEMGKLARERVAEHFSFDRMQRGILSLVQ